ncbi:MAG: protein-tyrosine phosphatase family protein [Phycisphaerae bacterium]
MPKRFAAVEEGRLYRCGSITPYQLEHITRKYGVRTVLSLLNPDVPESVAEREAARRLGLRWVNVALPGDGGSTPEQREKIKAVLFDPDAGPLLVHCAAGTNRTGLAVGLYRLRQHAWTLEQVLAEMREFGFADLPRHQNLREALASEWQAAQFGGQASTRPDNGRAPPESEHVNTRVNRRKDPD